VIESIQGMITHARTVHGLSGVSGVILDTATFDAVLADWQGFLRREGLPPHGQPDEMTIITSNGPCVLVRQAAP